LHIIKRFTYVVEAMLYIEGVLVTIYIHLTPKVVCRKVERPDTNIMVPIRSTRPPLSWSIQNAWLSRKGVENRELCAVRKF